MYEKYYEEILNDLNGKQRTNTYTPLSKSLKITNITIFNQY